MSNFKERINYKVDDGYYCGNMVNLPIVIQADNLEDLKKRTRAMVESYINVLQKTLDNDEFEYVEVHGW